MLRKKSGFRLIELLVVVAIISLLSSIVMASLNSARAKARDAQRKENLHQLDTALRMYYLDNNDFPRCGVYGGGGWTVRSTEAAWNACMAPTLQPYLSAMPVDPVNGSLGGLSLYYYYICYAADSSSACSSAYINN